MNRLSHERKSLSRAKNRRAEFVRSLANGLSVVKAFSRENPSLTLSEVAKRTGLTRATARRLLLTLTELGYVASDDRRFSLRPRVLDLGYAYLSSLSLWEIAQPSMEALVEKVHESCSASVLDGDSIVYVARVPTKRIMAITLAVGSRLPAHATSMGRVLLAALPQAALDEFFRTATLTRFTERTIVDPTHLREILSKVKANGWALIDQEFEVGLRSIAAPIHDASGNAVAAINVATHVARVSKEKVLDEFLPHLLATAAEISAALVRR